MVRKASRAWRNFRAWRSEEHTSELQSLRHLVCRLLLEKKNNKHLKRGHLDALDECEMEVAMRLLGLLPVFARDVRLEGRGSVIDLAEVTHVRALSDQAL